MRRHEKNTITHRPQRHLGPCTLARTGTKREAVNCVAPFRFLAALTLIAGCTPSTPAPQEPQSPAPAPTSAPPPEGAGPSDGAAGGNGVAGVTQERACGGIAGLRCPEKQYCLYAPEAHCGAADMTGTCAPIPDMCTQQVDEVCGCDDKTYSNACMAAHAGVSVVMKGACQTTASGPLIAEGKLCGTRGVPGECAPGLYCAFKTACGATDSGGICKKKTTMCTKIYKPVCGCDGKTYGNDCTAAAEGVSVAAQGECKKN